MKLAVAALLANPDDLVQDLQTTGFLFENLCVRDLRAMAEALDGTVFHYRDKNELECDAIVHLRDGRYGLIEVKLGSREGIEQGLSTIAVCSRTFSLFLLEVYVQPR